MRPTTHTYTLLSAADIVLYDRIPSLPDALAHRAEHFAATRELLAVLGPCGECGHDALDAVAAGDAPLAGKLDGDELLCWHCK